MKIPFVILFFCFSASTVSPGSLPSTTTLLPEAETLPQGEFLSSTEPSSAASTLSAARVATNQPEVTKLKDTTMVIIVSVSLALLVCAIIPLIFCRNCQSNAGEQSSSGASKSEAGFVEETADVSFTQAAVTLQSSNPETSDQSASQYATVYQSLDFKSLD